VPVLNHRPASAGLRDAKGLIVTSAEATRLSRTSRSLKKPERTRLIKLTPS
jgi:hypothetical protein